MRKIVTTCNFPPIPDRRFDWAAFYEGNEEGDVGHGETEQAAIDDLVANYDEPPLGWVVESKLGNKNFIESREDAEALISEGRTVTPVRAA